MAILDHFRFGAARRPSFVTSDAASGSSGQSSKSNRSANVLKLAKSFSWKTDSSSNSDSSNDDGGLCNTVDRPEKGVPSWLKKKNKKKDAKKMHPSEKPLTMVNIQHQEMLSHFTWTFGNRRDSYDERLEVEGISPGTSRMPSMDGGRPSAADLAQGGQQQSSSSSDADRRERVPHGELFHSAFLSPDSAATAFGPRRSAMRGAE